MNRIALLCTIVFLCPQLAVAEDRPTGDSSSNSKILSRFIGGFSNSLIDGFYDREKGVLNQTGVSMLASAATTAYFLYSTDIDNVVSGSPQMNLGGERTSLISDVGQIASISLVGTFIAASQFFDERTPMHRKTVNVAFDLAEGLALTYTTTSIMKFAVGRERPNEENFYSFPSNHTASAFVAAGVIANHYPWYIGVPSLVAASAVGLSRVDLNVHYASDVIAGAGIGLFYATAVSRKFGTTDGKNFRMLTPIASEGTYGIALASTF